jgi:hypothetical protein
MSEAPLSIELMAVCDAFVIGGCPQDLKPRHLLGARPALTAHHAKALQ